MYLSQQYDTISFAGIIFFTRILLLYLRFKFRSYHIVFICSCVRTCSSTMGD